MLIRSENRALVHWTFPNDLWREFIYYDNLEKEHHSLNGIKSLILALPFLSVLIITFSSLFIIKIGFLSVSIVIIVSIAVFYIVNKVMRKYAEEKLKTEIGDVKITKQEIVKNNECFFWAENWSLESIGKEYFHYNQQQVMILKFVRYKWVKSKHQYMKSSDACMIPVPLGKEAEADFVISELEEIIRKKQLKP